MTATRHSIDTDLTSSDKNTTPINKRSALSIITTKLEIDTVDESFRVANFADKHTLSWWFPKILDDETKSWHIWISKRSRAILIHLSIVNIVFFTNLSLTLFALTRYGSQNAVGLIYEGNCDKVHDLDQWLHLLINLLSTGMLSASNYCMQLQAAPTRANVDKAHKSGKWVDIGVPSLRNLAYISTWKRISWALLALSSVPVHMLYNSAVFQSLASNIYTVAVVKDSFINGTTWNINAAEINNEKDRAGWIAKRPKPGYFNYTEIILNMQSEAVNGNYEYRNITNCYELYDDYFKPQGNVIIFLNNETIQSPPESSLLMFRTVTPRADNWRKNMWALTDGTRAYRARPLSNETLEDPTKGWKIGAEQWQVSHCLVQPPSQITLECRLQYSPQIMLAICTMNLIKAVVITFIWLKRKHQETTKDGTSSNEDSEVLYTLGDAISSFMRTPDWQTRGMCLSTKYDFQEYKSKKVVSSDSWSREPREWKPEPKRWGSSVSLGRWIASAAIYFLGLTLTVAIFSWATSALAYRRLDTSVASLYKTYGFGDLNPFTLLAMGLPQKDPDGLIINVLVANTPQLILSVLYITINIILTTFLVQHEFSRMYRVRKPLRVSEPMGIQRGSYFVSLPLRFGLPMGVFSGLMHWLLSRSLFLARVAAVDSVTGEARQEVGFSSCGFSPFAVFITIIVGVVLMMIVVALGFRKYDGVMRMVGTNSLAIASACHVLPEDREDGYLLPVQWGVVSIQNGVGRCAFTTAAEGEIRMPREGQKYR
ncbi:hypothetical protein QBC38DRAFT_423706 [Podospora fimiseda]|uniref:DUF6536 domain-containing protein n=1 Tax=Podospora fimiseda TaxID=252190 RepID=A0AAN7BJ56_9PEZI|nr:hypothetical protein QBC38DRAFT_423706 [Podospora fimiseda]